MKRIEYVINKDLLPYLSKLAGENPLPLSPWAKIARKDVDNVAWEKLCKAGLAEHAGTLKEEALTVIQLLSKPITYARMRIVSGNSLVEHLLYGCKTAEQIISLTVEGEALRIRYPAPTHVLLNIFAEYWGSSVLVSSKLDLVLDFNMALTFGALVDLQRRQLLKNVATMQTSEALYVKMEDIKKTIENTPHDAQWLVENMRSFTQKVQALSALEIEKALEALIENQVLGKKEEGYHLIGEGQKIASNCLLISQILYLEFINQKEKGEMLSSAMTCLQAGLHDNFIIDPKETSVRLHAASASAIKEIVQALLVKGLQVKSETKKSPFYIYRDGQKLGPYSRDLLNTFLANGKLTPSDFVWYEGLAEWKPVSEIK